MNRVMIKAVLMTAMCVLAFTSYAQSEVSKCPTAQALNLQKRVHGIEYRFVGSKNGITYSSNYLTPVSINGRLIYLKPLALNIPLTHLSPRTCVYQMLNAWSHVINQALYQ